MAEKAKYRTKQREILLNYFKSVPGVHITVADACEYLKSQGLSIGRSTVYRQIESLVDEGFLNKYIIDGNSPACFEYIPDEEHRDKEVCFHCKCEKCGKLIHLHCEEVSGMQEHLKSCHHFRMDPRRTVFYGICEECV